MTIPVKLLSLGEGSRGGGDGGVEGGKDLEKSMAFMGNSWC